jgi:hypothetical protein
MYYIYKAKIDLKKESDVSGSFKIYMDLPNVVIETSRKLTDNQIANSETKLKQILRNRFNMTNLDIELINIIK